MHRDIKPENVLLEEGTGRPKVADFGLARAISEVSNTTTGTVLGTVAYLAPETISTGHVDTRADVYAVGSSRSRCSRSPAARGGGAHPGRLRARQQRRPAGERVRRPPGPPAGPLVRALTARDPDQRPRDAAVALDALRSTFRQIPERGAGHSRQGGAAAVVGRGEGRAYRRGGAAAGRWLGGPAAAAAARRPRRRRGSPGAAARSCWPSRWSRSCSARGGTRSSGPGAYAGRAQRGGGRRRGAGQGRPDGGWAEGGEREAARSRCRRAR